MRVGLVCPYPWDVPGGVMAHVRDLAEALLDLGHGVSVISPVDDDTAVLPPYVVPAGRAVPVPFNGSTARLAFGPISAARVRRWLRYGDFDVLHVHSPEAPSLSLLACMTARGPIVATFHAANPRSRVLAAAATALQPVLEKIQGRIAVSPAARTTIVEHLGGDAVVIPNGVNVRALAAPTGPFPGWPGDGGAIGFLGRLDEPRKGLAVLLEAFEQVAAVRPQARLLVAGPGELTDLRRLPPGLPDRVTVLGRIPETDKPRFFRSLDLYAAPNTGGESFGIILLEAMAAGCPIVASDLPAFRRVLQDGAAGSLVPAGEAPGIAAGLAAALDDRAGTAARAAVAGRLVQRYDWPSVARQIVRVYETVLDAPGPGVREDSEAR